MDSDLEDSSSSDDIQLLSPRQPTVIIQRPLEVETSSSLDVKLQKRRRRRFNRFVKLFISLAAVLLIITSLYWRVLPMSREQDTAKDVVEDEPNPPMLPDSVKIFYPPKTQQEIIALHAELSKFSDPIVTKEEFFNVINQISCNITATN